MSKPIITICSSAAFYKQAVDVQDQLEKFGFEVIVPATATRMKESGDFDVSHYKTWFADANDYHKKAQLMRAHFEEVEKGDAILVLNYEKHGVKNYIGGNVLMEMAIAFWLKKPIFIMNEMPEESAFEEEIKGMEPTLLHGDTKALPKLYEEKVGKKVDELWQLYDEQGQVLNGEGAKKDEVFNKGLLHGASHVWIWRNKGGQREVLLQQRASNKRTWPNLYDISAAGHIDLGEKPLNAAIRETVEEIGLDTIADELKLFCVHRTYLKAENGAIENEFQWLYSLELNDETNFTLQSSEVKSLKWVSLEQFKVENKGEQYVPHGELYYDTVVSAIESAE